jgi:hypothetical protein
MIKLTKILNELKLSDLVGKTYTYVVGSGGSSNSTPNSKEKVLQFISEAIRHYLFDSDFYMNYLDSNQQKVYKSIFEKEVLTPLLKNIDKTLQTYFELKSDKYRTSVVWKIPIDKTRLLIDTLFRTNKKVPSDIKKAYYDYRLEYAGVKLKEGITEVAYDGNLGFHEMFQFYSKANDSQIDKLEDLIRNKKFKDAWKFVQKITGMKLKGSQFESTESVNEANAVSGGKVHKFITGKNLTFNGKKYSDIEFEVLGIDNTTKLVNLKVLFPKNLFGEQMKVSFKTIRRGPFIKTDTSNPFK